MRSQVVQLSIACVLLGALAFSYRPKTLLQKSRVDGRLYRVRGGPLAASSADMLAEVRLRLERLLPSLDTISNPFHKRLAARLGNTSFMENPLRTPSPSMTSYSINKGEYVVLCLRDPVTGKPYDLDLVTYVVLHEAAHIACPEIGHTPLFRRIFADLLVAAKRAGILLKTDYLSEPTPYCGITIAERIVS